MKRVIYDVGSNNGDDIPYYLMKADKVVAIEANPELSDCIKQKYSQEIIDGRLIVENCAVTDRENMGEVDFYIYTSQPHLHVFGQFPPPSQDKLSEFTKIKVLSKSITGLVNEHGYPYYMKIDVNENYEVPLLKSLFSSGIRPKFISAESHTMDVFLTLVREGQYRFFKMVDCSLISEIYKDCLIDLYNQDTKVKYSFPHHSAGPFENDINGEWMNTDDLFKHVLMYGTGWKDIHATNL